MPLGNLTRTELLNIVAHGVSLTRADLKELHCIQPIQNVPSILERGILSHVLAESVPHVSIAMEEIQDIREDVVVPGGRPLHEYANLYVNARNKMLSKLCFTRDHRELCVLRVSTDVLDLDNTVVASENASTSRVRFAPSPGGLELIKRELVEARSWNHDEAIAKKRHGALICAEVLVPDEVPPEYVRGAYVSTTESRDALGAAVTAGFKVTIKSDLFFR